jgi:hypothetical protein
VARPAPRPCLAPPSLTSRRPRRPHRAARASTARDPAFLDALAALRPELCVTAAYGNMLPAAFLSLPTRGTLNVHPSLLPKYRGAAPVQRALQASARGRRGGGGLPGGKGARGGPRAPGQGGAGRAAASGRPFVDPAAARPPRRTASPRRA